MSARKSDDARHKLVIELKDVSMESRSEMKEEPHLKKTRDNIDYFEKLASDKELKSADKNAAISSLISIVDSTKDEKHSTSSLHNHAVCALSRAYMKNGKIIEAARLYYLPALCERAQYYKQRYSKLINPTRRAGIIAAAFAILLSEHAEVAKARFELTNEEYLTVKRCADEMRQFLKTIKNHNDDGSGISDSLESNIHRLFSKNYDQYHSFAAIVLWSCNKRDSVYNPFVYLQTNIGRDSVDFAHMDVGVKEYFELNWEQWKKWVVESQTEPAICPTATDKRDEPLAVRWWS